jgi:hypothetical protein
MTRAVPLLLVPLVAVALAAPVPKQTEAQKIEAKFGKIVDPKGDSTFALDGDKLSITLPAGEGRGFRYENNLETPNDLSTYKRIDITPRIEFEQKGNFVLTVRVHSPLSEKAEPISKGTKAVLGGGFRFTPKDQRWYRFGIMQMLDRGKMHTGFPLDNPGTLTNSDSGSKFGFEGFEGETVWLRVTRKGETVTREASTDGKEWKEFKSTACEIADETITISLYALHHSDTKHTVTFDEFRIETPKK